jgi:predicted Zn finger-like uncharacterized protein
MIIQCEKCERKFRIDDSKIKPPGNRVRCSKCGNVFFVEVKQEPDIDPKEISVENLSLKQERGLEEEPTDGIKMEEFVSSISKVDEKEVNFRAEEATQASEREWNSGFSWENISINKEELIEPSIEPPKLFSDTTEEVEELKSLQPIEVESSATTGFAMNTLGVDMEKLLITKKETLTPPPYYQSMRLESRSKGSRRPILRRITSAIITLLISIVIIGATMAILINVGLVSKDKVNRVSAFIVSKLPVKFTQNPRDSILVSDHSGRWVSTKNGFIYVVSGHIVNKSDYVVNYVRLQSGFTSGGEQIFEQVFYAGNTFTENELKTLPVQDVLLRLNRRNGDIDYYNPDKLAGLNYGIKPGESVPFFTVFPAKSRILGLKYNIKVLDAEKAVLE